MIRVFHRYYPARKLIFFVTETFLIFAAIVVAFYLRLGFVPSTIYDPIFVAKFFVIICMIQIWLYYFDLYSFRAEESLFDMALNLLQAIGLATFFVGLIYLIFPSLMISNWSFLIFLFVVILFAVSWRLIYFYFLKNGFFSERIAILGVSDLAKSILQEIRQQLDCGFLVPLIVAKPEEAYRAKQELLPLVRHPAKVEEDIAHLYDLCREYKIKKIVVCLEERRGALPVKELLECRMKGIDVVEGETFYEHLAGKIIVEKIRPSWLIFHGGFAKPRHTLLFKRLIGVFFASLGLFLSLPLIVLVAILIKLDSPGPVLFVQERVGKDGKVFKLYKFRSMRTDAEKDKPKWAGKNDPRVTRVGRIIRKLRIDEIPQMWNVLKGDMSFVGPRPERPYFVERLRQKIPFYDQRHTVQPGITGWAQICYPYGASDEDALEKLKYDLYYIKYMSTMFDLYIIFKTVKIILFGEGAR